MLHDTYCCRERDSHYRAASVLALLHLYTHTHTHTHILLYIYVVRGILKRGALTNASLLALLHLYLLYYSSVGFNVFDGRGAK
jgi:hypothetical protein